MSFDEQFGADLSDDFFNDTFKDAKVKIRIEKLGTQNYNSQGTAIVTTFDGEGFNLNPSQSDRANFEQTVNFKVKVKASEVGFKPSIAQCNFYVEQRAIKFDSKDATSQSILLGGGAIINNNNKHDLIKVKALSITTDTLGAVHTILASKI